MSLVKIDSLCLEDDGTIRLYKDGEEIDVIPLRENVELFSSDVRVSDVKISPKFDIAEIIKVYQKYIMKSLHCIIVHNDTCYYVVEEFGRDDCCVEITVLNKNTITIYPFLFENDDFPILQVLKLRSPEHVLEIIKQITEYPMPKLQVNLQDIWKILETIKAINNTPLEDITFLKDGEPFNLDPKYFHAWALTGLNNVDFIKGLKVSDEFLQSLDDFFSCDCEKEDCPKCNSTLWAEQYDK